MNIFPVLLKPFFWSYILLLTVLVGFSPIAAQDTNGYIHYDVNNGLPGNKVYSCLQDSNGYMWFASEKGLIKYNGYEFKVLTTTNAGLPDNDVYQLQLDSRNRLWIHTLTNRFGYINKDVYNDIDLGSIREKTNRIVVSRINELNGVVFFALDLYYKEQHVFGFDKNGRPLHVIYPVIINGIDSDNNLYFLNIKKRNCVNRFNTKLCQIDNVFMSNDKEINLLGNDYISWVTGNKIIFLNNKPGHPYIASLNLLNSHFKFKRLKDFLPHSSIFHTASIYTPTVTIYTDKEILTLNADLELVSREAVPKTSLENLQVNTISIDKNGDKWYTTNYSGIWCKSALPILLKKNFLPDNVVVVTGAQQEENIWLWNNTTRILYMVEKQTRQINKWQLNIEGKVTAVIQKNNTNAYIFSNTSVWELNLLTGAIQNIFTKQKKCLINSNVNTELEGNKWYGDDTLPAKLLKADFFSGSLYTYKNTTQKIIVQSSLHVKSIEFSKDAIFLKIIGVGRFPSGTYHNLFDKYIMYSPQQAAILNPATEQIARIDIAPIASPLISKLSAIRFDSKGYAYILTDKALLQLNPFRMQWQVLPAGFNLTDAKMEISNDHILLAGRFGLAVATAYNNGAVSSFHYTVNIKSSQYHDVQNISAMGKQVLLQTDKGWLNADIDTVWQQGSLAGNNSPGTFTIVQREPLNRKLYTGDTLQISQDSLRLLFDAVNFYGIGNVQYSFRTGNGNWTSSASGDYVATGMAPGKYYPFYVKINDDAWQSGVLRLYVFVKPYWYQTNKWQLIFWIGGSLLVLLAGLGIVSVTRYWVHKADAKRQLLTDLELRAIHAQINPHFIFNTLSTALYFISRKEYDSAYSHVNKFSHLLRSYLKSSQDRYVLLSEEVEMLKRYIELQQARFEHRFDYNIHVDNKVPAGNIQLPSLLLQPLVENAINHGLFHRREPGGLLTIRFEHGADSNELICQIEDNGVGRDHAAALKRSFDADRESYGSRLTEKLMSVFRQYEAMDIRIDYTDKQLPETGTVVTLIIKNIRYFA